MSQSANETAKWGQCEGCEKEDFLLPVPGYGDLCMACECGLICSEIEASMKGARA